MKKLAIIGIVFLNIQALDNEFFNLKNEVEKFTEAHIVEIKAENWQGIGKKFKEYSPDKALRMYTLLVKRFLLIRNLDDLVQQNTAWRYIRHLGLETTKLQIMKNNRINDVKEEAYYIKFDAALSQMSTPAKEALEKEALTEVFDCLAQVSQTPQPKL